MINNDNTPKNVFVSILHPILSKELSKNNRGSPRRSLVFILELLLNMLGHWFRAFFHNPWVPAPRGDSIRVALPPGRGPNIRIARMRTRGCDRVCAFLRGKMVSKITMRDCDRVCAFLRGKLLSNPRVPAHAQRVHAARGRRARRPSRTRTVAIALRRVQKAPFPRTARMPGEGEDPPPAPSPAALGSRRARVRCAPQNEVHSGNERDAYR